MGGLGKLLSFVRQTRNGANVSDATVDPGGGPNLTAEHFAAPGDDSYPLRDDFVLLVPLRQTGRAAAAGYLDPKNAPQALAGERRTYARDDNGDVVATVWARNTGAVQIFNDAGSFELQPSGDVVINGVTIATDGTITTPTQIVTPSAVIDGVEAAGHNHTQANDSAGNSEQPTNPMQEP